METHGVGPSFWLKVPDARMSADPGSNGSSAMPLQAGALAGCADAGRQANRSKLAVIPIRNSRFRIGITAVGSPSGFGFLNNFWVSGCTLFLPIGYWQYNECKTVPYGLRGDLRTPHRNLKLSHLQPYSRIHEMFPPPKSGIPGTLKICEWHI
jgi:hypothetical protein